jgi:hypothetical protein
MKATVAEVDRTKHQWDLIERVLGGVRASIEDGPSSEVVAGDVHGNTSGPHMAEQHPPEQQTRDRHQEYESDRRGEHKYPRNEQDEAERPSQRERDELKKRLEKQS